MVPIDDVSMVLQSIENWNASRLHAGLQQQQQVYRQGTQCRSGTKVLIMDQISNMADSYTFSMHIVARPFLLRQEEWSCLIWF